MQGPGMATEQQMPPEVYQLAGTYQLGTLNVLYKPTFTNPLAIIGITIGVIILDIILAAVIYNVGFIVYILFLLPIFMIVFAINRIANCNLRVYAFTNGLVRAKGSQNDVIRWDQVQAVLQNITRGTYSGTTHNYTVRRGDGATFKFGSVLRNVANLGQTLQQEVARALLPRAIAAYNAGSALPFGSLSISVQGINNGSETVPWNQVQNVEVKQGFVLVKKMGKSLNWARVKVSTIPNFPVFMGMVSYARGGQR